MTILLDPYIVPEKGKVELKIDRSFEIKVTAEEARHKVRWWLRDEVSMLIDADPPTLVIGEEVVWRVPAWVAFVIIARELVITGFRGVAASSGIVVAASSAGKLKSVFQYVALCVLIFPLGVSYQGIKV